MRSDYMIDSVKKDGNSLENIRPYEMKQVEFNTLGAAFAGLCTLVSKLHR